MRSEIVTAPHFTVLSYLGLFVAVALAVTSPASGQNTNQPTTALAGIEAQTADADAVISQYSGGRVLALAQARCEALLLLRIVVESKRYGVALCGEA